MKMFTYPVLMMLVILSGKTLAASDDVHLDQIEIDLLDKASLQRGAQTFVNYCLSCHQASFMRYKRLAKDLGLTDSQVKQHLMFASDKIGDTMTIAMRDSDAKKWFGVVPPDLSVIARSRGTDWLNTYLSSFYLDDTQSTGTNNMVFQGVSMPHVLWKKQGYAQYDNASGQLIPCQRRRTVNL